MWSIDLELKFVNSTSGAEAFKLIDKYNKQYQIWECRKNAPGSKAYHILSYFPTAKNQVATFTDYYKDKKWFDYDKMIMNMANSNQNGDVVGVVAMFIESPAYKFEDQDYYIQNGMVYAEDENTGIVRQLVNINVTVKNETGPNTALFHFYTLSRSENWNWALVANLIESQSHPMPGDDLKDKWLWNMKEFKKDIEVVVEDVYVYDGRFEGED